MESDCDVPAWTRVFTVPELFQSVIQYLDPKHIHRIRLLSKHCQGLCAPHFSIILNIDNQKRYSTLIDFYNLAMIADGSKKAVNKNPFDQIKGLIVSTGQSGFSEVLPEGMSAVLNQCRNLRSIQCADASTMHSSSPFCQPANPARLIWSNMDLPVALVPSRRPFYKKFFANPDRPPEVSPSSFWDQLPLEGSLLCRLESLTLSPGTLTPKNLDQFFVRLKRSCVSKGLRFLVILGEPMWHQINNVSLEVLLDCFCGLKVLEELKITNIMIVANQKQQQRQQQPAYLVQGPQLWPQNHSLVAPTVKTLVFEGPYTFEIARTVLECFPNLRSLSLAGVFVESMLGFFANNLDPLSVPRSTEAKSNSNASPIIFPHLQKLYIFHRLPNPWVVSRVLKPLARQGSPGLQIGTLIFGDQPYSFSRETPAEIRQMVEDLSQELVSVQHLIIDKVHGIYNTDLTGCILTSGLCRSLVTLDISSRNLIGIKPYLWSQVSHTTREDVRAILPWTGTVRKLVLRRLIDSRLGSYPDDENLRIQKAAQPPDQETKDALLMTRDLLRLMPCLDDLEIIGPIFDLSLFHSLGRAPIVDTKKTTITTTMTTAVPPSRPSRKLTYSIAIERPLLRRLQVCISHYSKRYFCLYYSSKEQLLTRFQFLEDLEVNFEPDPFPLVGNENRGGGT